MTKRRMYTIALTVLLLGVMVTTDGVWTAGSFSHGLPANDHGCYCHNNGIAVFVNGTGDGGDGVFFGNIMVGSTFHLLVSTNDTRASGVVPQLQLWESNQTDNAKFTFSPTNVTANSAYNLSSQTGNITALYNITAPTTPGEYALTLYSQGTLLMGVVIQVVPTITSTIRSIQTIPQIPTSTHAKVTSSIPDWAFGVIVGLLFLGLLFVFPLILGLWWEHQEPAAKGFKIRTEAASFQHAENELGGRLRGHEVAVRQS